MKRLSQAFLLIVTLLVTINTNAQQKQVSTTYYPGTKVKQVEYEYVSGKVGTVGDITIRDKRTGLIKERDLNSYSVNSMTPHGFWREYYENGKLQNEFNYVNGSREGTAKAFYDNGSVNVLYNYKNNIIDGDFTEYYENGKVQAKCVYVNAKRTGSSIVFDSDGNIEAYLTYSEPTETGNYLGAGEKEFVAKALYQIKYPNGKIKEDGYLKSRYSQDRYSSSFYYNDFLRQGVFKTYDENGVKTEENPYKNSMLEGTALTFYPNGKTKEETTYQTLKTQDNQILAVVDGPYKIYYENGQVAKSGIIKSLVTKSASGEYEAEQYNAGDWRRYTENGKLVQFMSYGRGDEVLCEMDEKTIEEQSSISDQMEFSKHKSAMTNKFTKYFNFHYGELKDGAKKNFIPITDTDHPEDMALEMFKSLIEEPAMVVFNQYLTQLKSCGQTNCVKQYSEKLDNVMQKLYHVQNVKEVSDRLRWETIQDVLKI